MLSTRLKTIPTWGVVTIIMALGPLLAAALATMMLDAFLEGPGPASVTTRVPGFVYASATAMKVGMLAGGAVAVIALMRRVSAGLGRSPAHATSGPTGRAFPYWGITAIALAPMSPLVGAVGVLTAQALARTRGELSMLDMSQISRTAVIVMLSMIALGVVAAVTALVRRERPIPLLVLGLVTNALLVGLFWHFEFYAVGFDQDAWAPR